MRLCIVGCAWLLLGVIGWSDLSAEDQPWRNAWAGLPEWTERGQRPATDWLIDPHAFAARVCRTAADGEIVMTNGLLARTFRLVPNAATVGLDQLVTGESLLRGVKPEAVVEINGHRYDVGGLTGQSNYAFLRAEWLNELRADPAAFQCTGFEVGQPAERLTWRQVRHHGPGAVWPPAGITLRLDFCGPAHSPTAESSTDTKDVPDVEQVRISVHYEMYDGIPCYCKWITVTNGTEESLHIDRFSSELLAVVERTAEVDELTAGRVPPNIHVETDMAFGGMAAAGANRRSYRWLPDPQFDTQVNYLKQTPCLLDIGPDLGPAQEVSPGGTFQSCRAWVLPFDSSDRERCGLAVRRMYRAVAPWVTENPLMMHVRYADQQTVTAAIDQCADVGFEMVILTFGSGFDLENEQPETLARAQQYAEYAQRKGIEIGSYSLLASRRISTDDDVVMPPGEQPAFGNSPCLGSPWGVKYFDRLDAFYRQSGFRLLEHDGSYPGDVCASEQHPGHRGLHDSRWTQWRKITDFYRWCRGEGIYLNVPDHYFLSGSSKTGMGYREVNWSLPRDQQVIHTRQNIFDGTWEKTPSMGWMFVPLTEYHGGGPAATIEPLDEHLDHYERMLVSNLACGVQACYRGPRLYDTQRTREMVQRWVSWFKTHRDILESDLIHGRRADARDVDWMLHVNPGLAEKGLLVVFNPLAQPVHKVLHVNLYYTGLTDTARVTSSNGLETSLTLERDYTIDLTVDISPQAMSWYVIK